MPKSKKLTKEEIKFKQEEKLREDRRLEARLNPRKEFRSMMAEQERRFDYLYDKYGHGA